MVTTENILSSSSIIHLGSYALLFTWFFLWLTQTWLKSRQSRVAALAVIFICAFIPLNGTTSIEYLRGVFGNLSMITSILLAEKLYRIIMPNTLTAFKDRYTLNYLIVLAGLLLYPFNLGLTLYDPYQYGYHPLFFGLVLLGIALLSWWKTKYFTLIVLLFAVGCYSFSLGESKNLWDYLIDPLLFLYTFFWCTLQLLKKLVYASR